MTWGEPLAQRNVGGVPLHKIEGRACAVLWGNSMLVLGLEQTGEMSTAQGFMLLLACPQSVSTSLRSLSISMHMGACKYFPSSFKMCKPKRRALPRYLRRGDHRQIRKNHGVLSRAPLFVANFAPRDWVVVRRMQDCMSQALGVFLCQPPLTSNFLAYSKRNRAHSPKYLVEPCGVTSVVVWEWWLGLA